MRGARGRATYTDQKDGQGSGDDQHEEDREDLVRVLGFLTEDVVDLGLFAVAQDGRNDGRGRVGILLDIDVEDIGDDTLRRAKGPNDNGCVDRFW